MCAKKLSLKDVITLRQQNTFVGRKEPLTLFRENLALAPTSPDRQIIFNVFGQGGMGKSTLLRRFRELATEIGAHTALSDDTELDIPSMLTRLAEQFESHENIFKAFHERYRTYRQLQHQLESDPETPQGLPGFLGRTLGKASIHLARQTPLGGAFISDAVEDAFAQQVEDWSTYVARKFKNKDEVILVQEPDQILTPLFLEGLQTIAERHLIALFFDTYERTSVYLDEWLRSLLDERYGEVPPDIILGIAGREELDRNLWMDYEAVLTRLPLEHFTEEEAREYLATKKIVDPHTVEIILQLSGGLPLLVAMLAENSPSDPSQAGAASGVAVERFLKWEENPQRRQAAVDLALPRRWNRDTVAQLIKEEARDEIFTWLKRQPFVEERNDGWTYHAIVRPQMLRYKYQESPQAWSATHDGLAAYYRLQRDDLGLDEEQGRKNESWQAFDLDALYHQLCAAPNKSLPDALVSFLIAYNAQRSFGKRCAATIEAAGIDSNNSALQQWGMRLSAGSKSYDEKDYDAAVKMFTELLNHADVTEPGRSIALGWRGYLYQLLERFDDSLAACTQALIINPKYEWTLANRGETHRLLKHYAEALADFTQALVLDSKYKWVLVSRGVTYRLMMRYEEALADFNQALVLDPQYAWAVANRGATYGEMKRYEEALADFNQALVLDPTNASIVANRGATYGEMKRYEEALADFNQALVLDPQYAWAFASRGLAYRLMKRYEEALADFNQALVLNPTDAGTFANRGVTYRLLKRYTEALADFDQGRVLNPTSASIVANRGVAYGEMKRYEEALADFNQALVLDPQYAWAIARRGVTYRLLKRYEEALADFNQALVLDPQYAWAIARRGVICREMKRYTEALADFDQALVLNPTDVGTVANRGMTYRLLKRYTEALADFDQALVLDPQYGRALIQRGVAYRHLGQYADAFSDFKEASNIEPRFNWAYLEQSITYLALNQYEDALHALEYLAIPNKATLEQDDLIGLFILHGLVLTRLGRYSEATAVDEQALEEIKLAEVRDFFLYHLAFVTSRLIGAQGAQSQIDAARTVLSSTRDGIDYMLWPAAWGISVRSLALYGLAGLEAINHNPDSAFDLLKQAVAESQDIGQLAAFDVAWSDLRTHPDFKALLGQLLPPEAQALPAS